VAGSFDFFPEAYQTERLKTLTVWSCFGDEELRFRPTSSSRSVLEHLVHQCLGEDTWMSKMLGIAVDLPPLPAIENRVEFLRHYAAASEQRLGLLRAKPDGWYLETTEFFDVARSRAWVLLRRLTHSAHHRAQLTVYLRLLGKPLYSTYGPTADTGGLPANGGRVIYRYPTVEALLDAALAPAAAPALPGPGTASPGERP